MMYIGQIGVHSSLREVVSYGLRVNPCSSFVKPHNLSFRQDHVTINSNFAKKESGINHNMPGSPIQSLGAITYSRLAPNEKLKAEILPASEQASYTERDALINQYLKQYRIEAYMEGDTFVCDSSEPVQLVLASQISESDLENFRQKLIENGLSEEIDWRGVKEDFCHIGVGFDGG